MSQEQHITAHILQIRSGTDTIAKCFGRLACAVSMRREAQTRIMIESFHLTCQKTEVKGQRGKGDFSGDLPDPEIEPGSPALQTNSLSSEPPRKPINL